MIVRVGERWQHQVAPVAAGSDAGDPAVGDGDGAILECRIGGAGKEPSGFDAVCRFCALQCHP
jgi:hypothetical protein